MHTWIKERDGLFYKAIPIQEIRVLVSPFKEVESLVSPSHNYSTTTINNHFLLSFHYLFLKLNNITDIIKT